MRKLWLLCAVAIALAVSGSCPVSAGQPPPREVEPRYNLGAGYIGPFSDIPRGGARETTLYFYSAFGNVTCYVMGFTVDEAPPGWRVEFEPEMVVVEPQWFSETPFGVGPGQICMLLKYVEDNENKQGYVRAWTVKVRVKVPENEALGTYTVRVGYVGDWRMEGMSVVKRAGSSEWRIRVVEATGAAPIPGVSAVWFAVLAAALAVPAMAFTRSKWVPAMARMRSRIHRPHLPKLSLPRIRLRKAAKKAVPGLMDQFKVHSVHQVSPAEAEPQTKVPEGEPESPLPLGHRPIRIDPFWVGLAFAALLALLGSLLAVGLI